VGSCQPVPVRLTGLPCWLQAQEKPLPPRTQKTEATAKIFGHPSAAAAQTVMEANLRKISLMLYASKFLKQKMPATEAFHAVGQYFDDNERQKEMRLRKKLADIVGEWLETGAVTARGISPERGGSRSPSPVIPDAKMAERLEQPSCQRKGAVPVKVVIPVHTESVPGNGDLAASLAMAEARIHDLVNERRRLNYAAKKVVNEVDALEKAGAATRKIIDDLRAQLQGVDDERAELQDKLSEFMLDRPSVEAETICAELKTVEGGRYSDTVRLIYYTLLYNGVSPAQVQGVIGRVLKLVGITAQKLPGTTCARLMQAEMAVVADFQAAEKLLQVPDGKAAIAGDEATKIGRSRFALGFFASTDGPGSPILFAALGVLDAIGGKAEQTKEAICTLLTRLADNKTLLDKFCAVSGESVPTKMKDLLKKFGCSMSDSCQAQRNTNKLMFDLVVAARCTEHTTAAEKEQMEKELRDFYCWLHKAINLCKATIKGMTFAEQHAALQRVDQEETRRIPSTCSSSMGWVKIDYRGPHTTKRRRPKMGNS
jgi:hypothetical protein